MILTAVAVILSLLILKQLGIFKGNMSGIRELAIAGAVFALVRIMIKIAMPFLLIAFAMFGFDVILWAGNTVFSDREYTLATWRFFRSVFLGMPF